MDKEKDPETTWERVEGLSLPNQVKLLCECIDEIKNSPEESETKPPKK